MIIIQFIRSLLVGSMPIFPYFSSLMAGNRFGQLFSLTSFGESHGSGIGGVIDGCPPGLELDMEFIQSELARRKPGQSAIVTQRKEADEVEFFSGVFKGKTTGTPIGFLVRNQNQKPKDYDHLKDNFRPSHADYTYSAKYGHRDYRGGGRSSARETIARVVAGAIAKLFLREQGITVQAYVHRVGELKLEKTYLDLDLEEAEKNIVRCPDPEMAERMIDYIKQIRKEGDTVGGIIQGVVKGVPAGLGEPVFDKLHANLGRAMLGINAVKGFEYGSGFAGATWKGSQHNDKFEQKDGKIRTVTNHSGGVQGGISNGEDIHFKVAFKPVATLMRDQESVNDQGETVTIAGKGRHDPCVLPRAVPIVEAMAAMVILDHWLHHKATSVTPD